MATFQGGSVNAITHPPPRSTRHGRRVGAIPAHKHVAAKREGVSHLDLRLPHLRDHVLPRHLGEMCVRDFGHVEAHKLEHLLVKVPGQQLEVPLAGVFVRAQVVLLELVLGQPAVRHAHVHHLRPAADSLHDREALVSGYYRAVRIDRGDLHQVELLNARGQPRGLLGGYLARVELIRHEVGHLAALGLPGKLHGRFHRDLLKR